MCVAPTLEKGERIQKQTASEKKKRTDIYITVIRIWISYKNIKIRTQMYAKEERNNKHL